MKRRPGTLEAAQQHTAVRLLWKPKYNLYRKQTEVKCIFISEQTLLETKRSGQPDSVPMHNCVTRVHSYLTHFRQYLCVLSMVQC